MNNDDNDLIKEPDIEDTEGDVLDLGDELLDDDLLFCDDEEEVGTANLDGSDF